MGSTSPSSSAVLYSSTLKRTLFLTEQHTMRFAAISAAVLSLVAMSIAAVCVPQCMTFHSNGVFGAVGTFDALTCDDGQRCQTTADGNSGPLGTFYMGICE